MHRPSSFRTDAALYGSTVAQVVTGLFYYDLCLAVCGTAVIRASVVAATDGRSSRFSDAASYEKLPLFFRGVHRNRVRIRGCLLDSFRPNHRTHCHPSAVQFMLRSVALTLIRRYRPDIHRPFKMWLYPVTSCIVAFAGWAFILGASGLKFILWDLRWQHSASSRTYGGRGTTGMPFEGPRVEVAP